VKTILPSSSFSFVIWLFTVVLTGCAGTDDGNRYWSGPGPWRYYSEPYVPYYGGWGPTYLIGPLRDGGYRPPPSDAHRPPQDGDHRPDRGGQHPPSSGRDHRPDQGDGHRQTQSSTALHPPTYRPAPRTRPIPSIPSRRRPKRSRIQER
jgi:hypothetical protein